MPNEGMERNAPALAGEQSQDRETEAETCKRNAAAICAQMEPVVRAILRRKALVFAGPTRGAGSEYHRQFVEDAWCEVRRRVLGGLLQNPEAVDSPNAYVRRTTHNYLNELLRERYPRRTSIQHRVRYLAEPGKGARKQPLIAVWEGTTAGSSACGRERLVGMTGRQGQAVAPSARLAQLCDDPEAAAEQFLGPADPAAVKFSLLVVSLLEWLGGPLPLDDLVGVLAHLRREVEPSFEPWENNGGGEDEPLPHAELMPTPDASPEQVVLYRDHLRQVWNALQGVRPEHCAALLLNAGPEGGAGLAQELLAHRIASQAELAHCLGVGSSAWKRLGPLWASLPLPDVKIAVWVGCAPTSIPVFRRRALKHVRRTLATTCECALGPHAPGSGLAETRVSKEKIT